MSQKQRFRNACAFRGHELRWGCHLRNNKRERSAIEGRQEEREGNCMVSSFGPMGGTERSGWGQRDCWATVVRAGLLIRQEGLCLWVDRMLYRQRTDRFGSNRMAPYIPVPLPPPALYHTSWQADHEGKFGRQVTSIKSSSVNDGSRAVSLRLFPSTAHSWQSKRPHVFPLTKMETFLSRMPLKFHGQWF